MLNDSSLEEKCMDRIFVGFGDIRAAVMVR
jgi:hypothetical protein